MELFPYILSRVAGLPKNQLLTFRLSEEDTFKPFLEKEKAIEHAQVALADALRQFATQSSHYQLKAYLRNLLRDLEQGRKVKFAKLNKLSLSQTEAIALASWEKAYAQLSTLRDAHHQWLLAFEEQYAQALHAMRIHFKTVLQQENLQAGLLMASHSSLDRLAGYLEKELAQHRKKEWQTELSLWQYYSRILTKTSPFSHFTRLALAKEDDSEAGHSQLSLNNLVLAYFQELLQKIPSFYPHLGLRLNPSMQLTEEHFIFILNTRNVESIQEMERSELLDFLYDQVWETPNWSSLQQLVSFLGEKMEAAEAAIEQFILQLVSYGFFEWDWKISGTAPDYLTQFIDKLASFPANSLAQNFRALLVSIEQDIENFSQLSLRAKRKVQTETHQRLEAFSETLLAEIPVTKEVSPTTDFQQFGVTKFFLKKEQLFYEDVVTTIPQTFCTESLVQLLVPLRRLLLKTASFFESKMAVAIQDFWKEHQFTEISLLEFYRLFYQKYALQNLLGNEVHSISEERWQKELAPFLQLQADGSLQIDLAYLRDVEAQDEDLSTGALVQVFEQQGRTQVVVNASFLGMHKYFGRFFKLFPDKVVATAKNWNRQQQTQKVFVENRDASYYNANVHPALVDFELCTQGSHQNLPEVQQIRVADLILKATEDGKPILINRSTGRRLCIFDFGFEALENRSAMYQLLNGFGPKRYSHLPLLAILRERWAQKNKQGIHFYPMIRLGEQLVLQRAGWKLPPASLPVLDKSISRAKQFLHINRWRMSHHFPDEVFVKNWEEETSIQGTKPQYVDFRNPFLVQIFVKILAKRKGDLFLETAMPAPAQGLKGKEATYCTELLLEFA